jgi:hypothetical protein
VRLFARGTIPHPFGRTGCLPDLSLFFQPFQQPIGLGRAHPAELGDLATADRTVPFDIPENHLFLLHGLEAALMHIRGLLTKPPIGGGGKVPTPPLALAARLGEPRLDQALQAAARVLP